MTTVETLRAARALLVNPENWKKGGGSPDAAPRCVGNTICFVRGRIELDDATQAIQRALDLSTNHAASLYRWNDSPKTTHADVLAAFDRAIADEEAREQESAPTPELGVGPYTRLRSLLDAPKEMAA